MRRRNWISREVDAVALLCQTHLADLRYHDWGGGGDGILLGDSRSFRKDTGLTGKQSDSRSMSSLMEGHRRRVIKYIRQAHTRRG